MLIFSTKLYVKESLTDEVFINKAIAWVKGGKNYHFGEFEWDKKEEISISSIDGKQKFNINKYSNAIVVHLVNIDGKIIWTSDFVLTKKNEKRILASFLYNDAVDMSVKLPESFNRPYLLKRIVSEGYGDLDGNIDTDNKPVIMNNANVSLAEELIMGKATYMMPVVYISAVRNKEQVCIDAAELAKDLAGVAHVMIEESYECTKKLKDLTDGINPYDGAVQIFYGLNITQRILPRYFTNSEQFRMEVAHSVYKRLILSRIDDEFSRTKLKYKDLERESKESIEIKEICDELLDEKEEIINVGKLRIQELEEKNANLNAKLMIYKNRLDNKEDDGELLTFNVNEKDLYLGEMRDVVVKVLQKELQEMEADANLKESRKYHVLESIVKKNKLTGKDEEIKQVLKEILNKDGSFKGVKRRKLNDLGFTIIEGKHYKIIYGDDKRYMFPLSKTASDYKTNINSVKTISKRLFGN